MRDVGIEDNIPETVTPGTMGTVFCVPGTIFGVPDAVVVSSVCVAPFTISELPPTARDKVVPECVIWPPGVSV